VSPSETPEDAGPPSRPAGRAYRGARHVRAAAALLLVSVLLLAVGYPLALVGFGELVNPKGAQGSLTYDPNGTVNNSSLLPPGTSSTVGGWAPAPPAPGAIGPAPAPPTVETLLYEKPSRTVVAGPVGTCAGAPGPLARSSAALGGRS
jgi:hypothetical protein